MNADIPATPGVPTATSPPQPQILVVPGGRRPRLGVYFLGTIVLVGAGVYFGMVPRLQQRALVAAETEELATPTFDTVAPGPGKVPDSLTLSAELKPVIETPVYARASGYVRKWSVDLGAVVKAGDPLAELETPELDREVAEAHATLQQAEAARALADTTAKRWATLAETRLVSIQEVDEKRADLTLKTAAVNAERARVQRLEQLVDFSKITAPFAGTITARQVDVGQLVSAGSSHELFRLARTDRLRAYIRVPQSQSRAVKLGQIAEIALPEAQGRTFEAKVVRTAGAIDAASRTLLTELEIDNSKGEILAGSYARVRLAHAQENVALTLPANTLLFRAEGIQAGVIDANNKVELRTLKLGRDFGPNVEILDGVTVADRVILNPPDSLLQGATVRPATPAKPEVTTAAR
ncbi:efflux RND transporter periplasmic adaptor subunit [Verrucomicrobium sp. BvORR106]|uniref:efflux RND transporter periplasmic adaptor subunit n=1 Tax=Verrucomicrobium sp. BvORR106 TaxID=1403819 RepID=UPI0006910121|nr:efflux RND transporter periplasmic adaptor subunit [Verrucomicrobium sp. BvORR106]